MPTTRILIEHLTLLGLLLDVFPFIFGERLHKGKQPLEIYYIDATNPGRMVAAFLFKWINASVSLLSFRMVDIRDEAGNLLRLRIPFKDLGELQSQILDNPLFKKITEHARCPEYLKAYLEKRAPMMTSFDSYTTWRLIYLMHVFLCKVKNTHPSDQRILLTYHRIWEEEINQYAQRYRLRLVFVPKRFFSVKRLLIEWAGEYRIKMLKNYFDRYGIGGILKVFYRWVRPAIESPSAPVILKGTPKLMVDYYGQMNLDHPELYSDLFFWQQSKLKAEDIAFVFNLPRDPLDAVKFEQIKRRGLHAVVVHPRATNIPDMPVEDSLVRSYSNFWIRSLIRDSKVRRWFTHEIENYQYAYDFWKNVFARNNVKIYISWFKYEAGHMAIADALKSLGGVSALYQRAIDQLPSPETMVACDLFFGFSKQNFPLEMASRSRIGQYVITGYNGDHRFSLVKPTADTIRQKLRKAGTQKIIAFLDENSGPDARWCTGHELMRDNYDFLLEKVLSTPWLGVIFKPKVAATLRQRLGPLADKLKEAEKTGRCYVFESGLIHSSYPVAVAALAADVAIHGHLCAATAGMEAFLAGTPTLLVDREGWKLSPFYQWFKPGCVYFTNWAELWSACQKHWRTPDGVPGFGDWSPIADYLDPFRDGRAAERMGTYLQWLLEGFKANLPKSVVLADAAERYTKIWGQDKIYSLDGSRFSADQKIYA